MTSLKSVKINTPQVVHETIDGEVVVINLEKGTYYSLVKVAAQVWNGVERGISFEQLIKELEMRYTAEWQEIAEAVKIFMMELQQEQLISFDESYLTNTHKLDQTISNNGNSAKINFEIPKLEKYTDMQDLLLLDPIHEVDETGWPNVKVEMAE
ncbi:MAG TPA: PqqD family protein [Oculatellaceae cyanobacterium]|jgi:hypothetical protein